METNSYYEPHWSAEETICSRLHIVYTVYSNKATITLLQTQQSAQSGNVCTAGALTPCESKLFHILFFVLYQINYLVFFGCLLYYDGDSWRQVRHRDMACSKGLESYLGPAPPGECWHLLVCVGIKHFLWDQILMLSLIKSIVCCWFPLWSLKKIKINKQFEYMQLHVLHYWANYHCLYANHDF